MLYFDRNLETLKTILSCAEKAAKIRKTEERAKTNLLTKQKYSFDSNGKLANCEKRDPAQCEIFIVEGDSAGGSATVSYTHLDVYKRQAMRYQNRNSSKIQRHLYVEERQITVCCSVMQEQVNLPASKVS